MKINLFLEREGKNKTLEIKNKTSIKDLLKDLKINPVTVVVSVNDEIVLEDYVLKNKDKIEVLSVVSGG